MRCFRLVDRAYISSAFSGDGARRYGGRWNSPGVALIYTAEFLSLAQLELLVHLEADDVLFGSWHYFAVEVADDVVLRLESWKHVPTDFFAWPASASTRASGDRWVADGVSVALSVPSALTPGERNLLLNPAHADYATRVSVGTPEPLAFDRRLLKGQEHD